MYANDQSPTVPFEDEYVPTRDGQVIETFRMRARHLRAGDRVAVLVDINHRHVRVIEECRPFHMRGAFEVYTVNSLDDPTHNLDRTRESIRGIYLDADDGTRRTLGFVDANSWIRVLD